MAIVTVWVHYDWQLQPTKYDYYYHYCFVVVVVIDVVVVIVVVKRNIQERPEFNMMEVIVCIKTIKIEIP